MGHRLLLFVLVFALIGCGENNPTIKPDAGVASSATLTKHAPAIIVEHKIPAIGVPKRLPSPSLMKTDLRVQKPKEIDEYYEAIIWPLYKRFGNDAYDNKLLQLDMTEGQRNILLMRLAECEIGNGGFHQFIGNCGIGVARHSQAAFELCGDKRSAYLISNALKLIPGYNNDTPEHTAYKAFEAIDYKLEWDEKAKPLHDIWFDRKYNAEKSDAIDKFIVLNLEHFFVTK
ncbi:hypothetical protein BH11PLA2_BH11PLA2_01080 [soil metagenome]